jgi:hypothetical protein
MRPLALQTLTWATVIAAVVSALWLAAVESEPGSMLHLTAAASSLRPLGALLGAPAAEPGLRRSAERPRTPPLR